MAETYKRETQQKFFKMYDDKNIMLQGSKFSSSDKTTSVENEASAAACRHFKEMSDLERADLEADMTPEEYEKMLVPPPPSPPIDYEADRVASLPLYEKLLKELYECKNWPTDPDYPTREDWAMNCTMPGYLDADTGPNKANKQSSFIPPSLSGSSKQRLSISRKVKEGKRKKKSCIVSNGKQKNNVARSTKQRKPRY